MVNYIQSLPAQNEEVKNKFLYKVMAANYEMPFIAEPEMTVEIKTVLNKIIQEMDAFIFAPPSAIFNKSDAQHFLDKNLNLILDATGNCEINDIEVNVDAKYHDQPAHEYSAEQIERKNNSEEFLNKHGIKINKNLPCIPSSTDIKLRTKKRIINRAYALLITAVKGEGIEQAHLERTVKEKNINSFSPKELHLFKAAQLNDQEKANATWRYESLYTILWALGKMDDLKFPNEICNVKAVVGTLFQPNREDFENSVKIKNVDEILNELDKTYRMNWACVDARIKGQPVGGNINPSVIYERHYALNWLTNYMDQEWDDVQTNT